MVTKVNGTTGVDKVTDNLITSSKIADGSVTSAKILDSSVTSSKISDSSVTSAKIEDGSVTGDKIENGSVTSAKIEDGSVTSSDLESNISFDASNLTNVPSASKALGSFSTASGQTTLTTSYAIMNIGTENKNTGEFSLSSSRVTVNKTGTFLVMYRLTTDCTSGSARSESQAQLYKNATAVQGTFGGMYNRVVDRGLATCSAQIILDITSGDIFDVRALKTGTDTVVQAQNGINLNFIEL